MGLPSSLLPRTAKFHGQDHQIDGLRVTVTAQGDLPAWVKAGRESRGGGAPVVLKVSGKEMT